MIRSHGNTSGQQSVQPFGSAAAGNIMWGRDNNASQSVVSGQQQQAGQQFGSPQQAGAFQQFGQNLGQGQQSGYAGQQLGQSPQWGQMGQIGQTGMKFGAHEIMMVHEVLDGTINSINMFELYKSHVKDQQLMQIIDKQVNHMYSGYQNIVSYLHNQGMSRAVPYRAPKATDIRYGLRQPSPVEPNTNMNEMDDRDVASGMMGCAKAKAVKSINAALECADFTLRQMVTDCAVSAVNQSYELFQYMNQKGMYQVPTLADQTTQTMINTYQVGSQPQF